MYDRRASNFPMIRLGDVWDRKTRIHLALALLVGLGLRLFFVLYLPAKDSDTELYEELGRNMVDEHVYAFDSGDGLVSTDVRMPGYPLFLAALYVFFGTSERAILIAQAFVDLATCVLLAVLAASLAPNESRRRVTIAAIWLGATCPFIANYAAVALSEVLATCFTTAALLLLIWADRAGSEIPAARRNIGPRQLWFLGGVVVGLGALVRPEVPITLGGPALVLGARWFRPADWPRLIRTGLLLAGGMLLPLLPWTARNWITLHKVQFLTGRYFQMPGAFIPVGFYTWTHTWLVSYKEVDNVLNRLELLPLNIEDFPSYAFDSPGERAQVQTLLEDQHRNAFVFSPEADSQFSQLARQRTARNPARTYFTVPFRRCVTLWFTPRTELLPYEGHWWPLVRPWEDYDLDFAVGLLFFALNFFYVALALGGAWTMWRTQGVALLVAFCMVRTVFIAVEHYTVEPRFVLPCIPAALALGALAWARRPNPQAPVG
jgi:4-amino-4-deoxy-L-arabinose transferase-like glycosyltransferase